jgi:hypothetical protein
MELPHLKGRLLGLATKYVLISEALEKPFKTVQLENTFLCLLLEMLKCPRVKSPECIISRVGS